jgi:hypothetical protein
MNKKFHLQLITQMLVLCTSAFGLVAALAWNTAIQTFINDFVKPLIPAGGSVLITQLIYAIIITTIVVTVTIYLTRAKENLEKKLKL